MKLRKIDEVLCDSGEEPLGLTSGEPVKSVSERACRVLDKMCLTNVVVFRAGKEYYVGEYTFFVAKVRKKAAIATALAFNSNDEEEAS